MIRSVKDASRIHQQRLHDDINDRNRHPLVPKGEQHNRQAVIPGVRKRAREHHRIAVRQIPPKYDAEKLNQHRKQGEQQHRKQHNFPQIAQIQRRRRDGMEKQGRAEHVDAQIRHRLLFDVHEPADKKADAEQDKDRQNDIDDFTDNHGAHSPSERGKGFLPSPKI